MKKSVEGWYADYSYVGTALVIDPDIVSRAVDLNSFVRNGTT